MSPQPETLSFCQGAPGLDVERMRFASTAQGTVLIGERLAASRKSCSRDDIEEPGPGGVLHAVDLDSPSPEVTADIGEDGTFKVALPGAPTDIYRLHVSTLNWRSGVVDISSSAGAAVAVSSCLGRVVRGLPEVPVPPGEATLINVKLENECQKALTITDAALRLGSEGFTMVGDPVGLVAEPLAPVSVAVRFEATTEGNYEDILLVGFAMGKEARTGVRLRATSR